MRNDESVLGPRGGRDIHRRLVSWEEEEEGVKEGGGGSQPTGRYLM